MPQAMFSSSDQHKSQEELPSSGTPPIIGKYERRPRPLARKSASGRGGSLASTILRDG